MPVATGSGNVYVNSQHAARQGDKTGCGGDITDGSGNVFIGGGTYTTDTIHPENLVPGWVHGTLLAVGLVSSVIVAGPIVAIAAFVGSIGFGTLGNQLGGDILGEGSDGQKWTMLGGSFVGGWAGGKAFAPGRGAALPATERVTLMNPNEIRFSQRTAGGNGRGAVLRESMTQNGWDGQPIDAVYTREGIVTIDNTRVAVARELNVNEVPVSVHSANEPLPEAMLGRFGNAKTWGEALQFRTRRQLPPLPGTGTIDSPTLSK